MYVIGDKCEKCMEGHYKHPECKGTIILKPKLNQLRVNYDFYVLFKWKLFFLVLTKLVWQSSSFSNFDFNHYFSGLPKHIQLWTFPYVRLLNKPYENEVTLRRQNPPLKFC